MKFLINYRVYIINDLYAKQKVVSEIGGNDSNDSNDSNGSCSCS